MITTNGQIEKIAKILGVFHPEEKEDLKEAIENPIKQTQYEEYARKMFPDILHDILLMSSLTKSKQKKIYEEIKKIYDSIEKEENVNKKW